MPIARVETSKCLSFTKSLKFLEKIGLSASSKASSFFSLGISSSSPLKYASASFCRVLKCEFSSSARFPKTFWP